MGILVINGNGKYDTIHTLKVMWSLTPWLHILVWSWGVCYGGRKDVEVACDGLTSNQNALVIVTGYRQKLLPKDLSISVFFSSDEWLTIIQSLRFWLYCKYVRVIIYGKTYNRIPLESDREKKGRRCVGYRTNIDEVRKVSSGDGRLS